MKNRILYGIILCMLLIGISAFTTSNNENMADDKFVVVLDAGHGGHDPGNRGNGYKEKDISLNVVLAVGSALEKDGRFEVIYTRKTDKFVELFERGKIANKAKADLFVSIHCNSHSSQAQGTETFVLGLHANNKNLEVAKNENSVILMEDNYEANYEGFDPNSPGSIIGLTVLQEEYLDQSLALASVVQDQFTNTLKRKSRGVKQAGFIVLHQTYMPSVLIELGFLTNNREGRYLNSKKGQSEMAVSITKSIIRYKENLDENFFIPEIVEEEIKVDTMVTDSKKIDAAMVSEIISPEASENEISFKVQISSGSSDIPLESPQFDGLNQLSKKKFGEVYKYFYGNTSDYESIRELQEIAITKGFTSSFVVAFRDNEMIPLSEALQLASDHE